MLIGIIKTNGMLLSVKFMMVKLKKMTLKNFVKMLINN